MENKNMHLKSWSDVKKEFDADGSLRDIYIENIDPELWNLFINEIRSTIYRVEFVHGDITIELPRCLTDIKEMQGINPTTLRIWLNEKIQVNCHFFIDTEIELDVSPQEICGEAEYQILVKFLEWLSDALNKQVILTHEGMQNHVILSLC